MSDQDQTKPDVEESIDEATAKPSTDDTDASDNTNSESNDITAELAAAELEVTKYKDAFLRAKAEQENIRRRSEKEITNSRKFAIEGFAKELLTVRDSLVLASSVGVDTQTDDAIKGIQEGVEITLKQLDAAFSKFSLTEIAPQTGDKLDPNLHQAMSILESDDIESGHIISIIQAGFQLHERLLRPAMVVVAK